MKITQHRNRWRVHLTGQEAHARLLAHYHSRPHIRRWLHANTTGPWRFCSITPWIGLADFTFGTLDDAVVFKVAFEGFAGEASQ